MALSEIEQAHAIIKKAANILLVVPEKASLDAIASMIALYLAFDLIGQKQVDEVSPQHVPASLQFLPGSSQISMQLKPAPSVTLDIAGPAAAAAIREEPLTGGLRIHISFPEHTALTKDQLEISVRALPYDAALVIGAADLEALGPLFSAHTDFFYSTPIINLDYRADNEHFGTVNLVDITKGSVAEVAYELISHLVNRQINPNIATALYAGIVAGTESFQKPGITPNSFKVAAVLLEDKADREAVIRYLVKTKPLELLKILGRIYARLRHDEHVSLFWSVLSPVDFTESGATAADLPTALRELTNNVSEYNAIALLHEKVPGRTYSLYLLLGKGLRQRRLEIQQALQATRDNGLLHCSIAAANPAAAETIALDQLRRILPLPTPH